MKTRLQNIKSFLKNNKKPVLAFSGIAASTAAVLTYKKITRKNKDFYNAYEKFRERVQARTSHHSMQSLFKDPTQYVDPQKIFKSKSAEPTVLLDASNDGAPKLVDENGVSNELNFLSSEAWQDFLKTTSGEIYFSFGHRKAFAATNPVQFTHAVMYVSDSKGHHALFGYSSNKASHIINDLLNTTVSHHYTLYPDLTIKGTQQQAQEMFERIEHFSLQPYTFLGCNCYSPLISGLLEAKKMGFNVPADFNDSLLIVIPAEQNYGMGITSNQYLGPLSRNAVHRTHLFFTELKEKTTQKMAESKERFLKAMG